jgi:polyisoprenoid-binding protein YceI
MSSTTAPVAYAIDPAHSSVEFVVRHLMIANVRGRFTGIDGSIDLVDGSDLPTAVRVTIDAATISTHVEQRDTHLRSADFFDVATYPQLTFVSSQIAGTPDAFTVTGTLTLHGVSREITLNAARTGRAKDPWGHSRIGYEATATIKRGDYGLAFNANLETGGVLISDEVRIELHIEAIAP